MATSGTADARSADGLPIVGKRKNFISPVATTYLLTVATSDGVDDAAGTPKASTIGNLNTEEGLRIGVATASFNLSKRITSFLRYGMIQSGSVETTRLSRNIGQEADLGAVYQMNSSTTLQLDYGRFHSGDYYSSRFKADLAALRMKYTF